jgi:hypothetical protein
MSVSLFEISPPATSEFCSMHPRHSVELSIARIWRLHVLHITTFIAWVGCRCSIEVSRRRLSLNRNSLLKDRKLPLSCRDKTVEKVEDQLLRSQQVVTLGGLQ